MAMPLLLLGVVIGVILVVLYRSRSAGGAPIFSGGET
jgi:preprotein translocase subunit SecG